MVHPFIIRPQRLTGYGAGVAADALVEINHKCDLSFRLRHVSFSLFVEDSVCDFQLSFLAPSVYALNFHEHSLKGFFERTRQCNGVL
jgi:hypothetical protein